MSETFHTAIATGAAANASVFNAPLGTLDSAIVTNTTAITGLTTTVTTLQNTLILGGAAVTLTNGAAAAAQKVVTVDSSAQFVAGCYVEYSLVGGVLERNVVDTVDSSTQITLITNIGTGGIADNSPVSVIPLGFYRAEAGLYNVLNYGASPAASEATNTAAINAAIAAAKAAGGGTIEIPPGTYAYDGAINLCETANIALVGTGGHFATILECHNTDGACIEIIGSKQITLENLRINGDATDTPAVGIWTGRTEPGVYAAGEDTSQIVGNRLHIYGAFTKALIYNTGCESTHWTNCYLYATNAACLAGVMTDYQNTLGLTPEHTTLTDPPIVQVLGIVDKCFITCDVTATSYSPIYTVYDYSPEILNTYLACWGAPAVYLKGGMPGSSVVIRDTGVEGTPTYLIYGDVWDGNPGGFSVSTSFRLDLYRFGGAAASSTYSIYLEDNSLLSDSQISQCNFANSVRFYNVANSTVEMVAWHAAGSLAPVTVAGYAVNSYFRVGYDDALTLSGNLVNVSVDYDSGADSPGTGYLLLAGGKGLAIGGAPGAALQGVIRKTMIASKAWAPGAISDGAAVSTYIDCAGVTADGKWFCQASYAGIGATDEWFLTAYAGTDIVNISLFNKTGGGVTPTGTLVVTATQIVET